MLALALALSLVVPSADGGAAAAPAPAAAKTAAPSSTAPAEFIGDVKMLYDVVTCQEVAPPADLDAKTIEAYCKRQKEKYDGFRAKWGKDGKTFLTGLYPEVPPAELVYPFGGGDLMMALVTFPDAKVITTLSLELAGDPRRLKTLSDKKRLADSLTAVGQASTSTLVSNDSLSKNLSKIQRGELPGQLSMHLMGLALSDFEPVSVRYFRIEDDGSLHYYTEAEIADLEGKTATKLKDDWKAPDFSPAFANVEVQFVPRGQPTAERRIHRHIGANLSDSGVKAAPGVLKHLEAKGRVATMTKAASYLLWNGDFSAIRNYLTSHAVFMISDSTGVPPRFWKKVGYVVDTYGMFQKSFLPASATYEKELADLYVAQKRRKLPLRFGYPDGSPDKSSHLMLAKPAPADAGVADAPKSDKDATTAKSPADGGTVKKDAAPPKLTPPVDAGTAAAKKDAAPPKLAPPIDAGTAAPKKDAAPPKLAPPVDGGAAVPKKDAAPAKAELKKDAAPAPQKDGGK